MCLAPAIDTIDFLPGRVDCSEAIASGRALLDTEGGQAVAAGLLHEQALVSSGLDSRVGKILHSVSRLSYV